MYKFIDHIAETALFSSHCGCVWIFARVATAPPLQIEKRWNLFCVCVIIAGLRPPKKNFLTIFFS
jgi:hypothetical protein